MKCSHSSNCIDQNLPFACSAAYSTTPSDTNSQVEKLPKWSKKGKISDKSFRGASSCRVIWHTTLTHTDFSSLAVYLGSQRERQRCCCIRCPFWVTAEKNQLHFALCVKSRGRSEWKPSTTVWPTTQTSWPSPRARWLWWMERRTRSGGSVSLMLVFLNSCSMLSEYSTQSCSQSKSCPALVPWMPAHVVTTAAKAESHDLTLDNIPLKPLFPPTAASSVKSLVRTSTSCGFPLSHLCRNARI